MPLKHLDGVILSPVHGYIYIYACWFGEFAKFVVGFESAVMLPTLLPRSRIVHATLYHQRVSIPEHSI